MQLYTDFRSVIDICIVRGSLRICSNATCSIVILPPPSNPLSPNTRYPTNDTALVVILKMDEQQMRIPLELIFQAMTSLLPSNPAAVIPASHDATQLLVAFGLVSRATHELSVQKLQQHCLYLDCKNRLRRFLICLEASRQSNVRLPSVFRDITSLYLAPFDYTLDNLSTARWVWELFRHTRESLRRLIIDVPFNGLSPRDDHLSVGPVLREGLSQLTKLEELVCQPEAAGFNMNVDPSEQRKRMLQQWPNLRRLGIRQPTCNERFWQCLAGLPNLELAVLGTPSHMISTEVARRPSSRQHAEQPITVVLAEYMPGGRLPMSFALPGGLVEDDMMRIMVFKIPVLREQMADIEPGSRWLMQTALDGELWDERGHRLMTRRPS
ncbi:hypothetical protein F5X99DRAFT_374397 [Biscogniauxia marginata]|nr:hypothetical protein F5X99DRAFT_374397 [Biscogniauxia marginata]